MNSAYWYFVWRRLICMGKMRSPSRLYDIDDRILDSGYCLDRYITGESSL